MLVKLWIQQLSLVQCRFIKQHPSFLKTRRRVPICLPWENQVISILVSPTLQQLPLKKELLPLKVVLELLQQHQVWPRLLIRFWLLHMLVTMWWLRQLFTVGPSTSWRKPFLVMGSQQPLSMWIIWKKWKQLSMTIPSLSWLKPWAIPWLTFLTWKNWLRLRISIRFHLFLTIHLLHLIWLTFFLTV